MSYYDVGYALWADMKLKVSDYVAHTFGERVIVETKSGRVRGFKTRSEYDFEYLNFLGIPYAEPPLGELRFKDPKPLGPQPADKIINEEFSLAGSEECQISLLGGKLLGIEDCLHISVYTRNINPPTKRPVMVWIHGGGFFTGSNTKRMYGPDHLLRNDVVLFAMNYRLGAFGFASFKDPEVGVPGNMGLKDQRLALEWINDNCMYFGGDPSNITFFGASSGGISVSAHLISERSKGLFHRAYMTSGNILMPWALSPIDKWTPRLGRQLGWNGEGGDKACWNVIKQATGEEIVRAQNKIWDDDDTVKYKYINFSPVIEPYESAQSVITKNPLDLIRTAWSKDIPLIISYSSDEAIEYYHLEIEHLQTHPEIKYESALEFHDRRTDIEAGRFKDIRDQITRFYYENEKVGVDTILTHLKVVSDILFVHPIHRFIVSRLSNGCAPTYTYRFNFESDTYSVVKKFQVPKGVPGACHGDDVMYYFKSTYLGGSPSKDSEEAKTIDRMCGILKSFAEKGDPNDEAIAPIQWKPTALNTSDDGAYKYKCLNISNELTFIENPDLPRMHFWDQIFKQVNENII